MRSSYMSRKGRGPDRRGELLRRFFSGITEHAFQVRLGVTDPPLIDYISELLIRFIRSENIYSIRSPNGERLRHNFVHQQNPRPDPIPG